MFIFVTFFTPAVLEKFCVHSGFWRSNKKILSKIKMSLLKNESPVLPLKEGSPVAPKRKPRLKRTRDKKPGEYTKCRTTKCSLVSSFNKNPEKQNQVKKFRKFLEELIITVNQIETLASLVI